MDVLLLEFPDQSQVVIVSENDDITRQLRADYAAELIEDFSSDDVVVTIDGKEYEGS